MIRFPPGSSRCQLSPCSRLCLALFLTVGGMGFQVRLHAAVGAPWHHAASPYRAVFGIVSKANHPKGGAVVAVPICGLGAEDGSELWSFDQTGQQLASQPVGKGARNEALALVRPQPASKKIYVYFGSKMRSPVHKTAFLHSLLCNVRTLPKGAAGNWQQVAELLKQSKNLGTVFVDKIEQAHNPVDSTDAVLLVFDGYLRIPKTGKYTYMMATDDAGYLFIDDRQILKRDGRHWARDAARGECRKEVVLTKGLHKVRMVLVDLGGSMTALIGQWIDGRNKYALRPQDFAQPGKTKLERLEPRHRNVPLPAFQTKELSYMSYAGAQYTEIEVGTHDGKEATFLFRDGFAGKGKTSRRILCGTQSMPVRVTRKRVTATGLVAISEKPPKARSLRNAADFKHYSALILSANLADLDASTLRGYIHFLNFRELNEDAVPVYEALVARGKLEQEERYEALVGLARAAAKTFPEKSAKAFAEAEKLVRGQKAWGKTAREYVEFLLYRTQDFATADKLLSRMLRGAPKDKRPMLWGLQLDLVVLQGKTDEAKKVLDELLRAREVEFLRTRKTGNSQLFAAAAVKSNALRQRYYDLMKAGFVLQAREVLHEWSDIAPVDRVHGTLPLARARYWERLGWLDGTLAELDGAILMDPLLPNLPEVELLRGMILQKAGENGKANEVFLKIVKEYPNHPAARKAKESVK